MALFEKTKKEKKGTADNARTLPLGVSHGVIRAPRITEKAAIVTEHGAYVFDVYPSANKRSIACAVEALYKVKPIKVNVVNTKARTLVSRTRGMSGKSARSRKAYVYLKKGDTIELM